MNTTNKLAAMVAASAIGLAGYEWIPWCEMTRSDWATWVQAIGSMAAIGVAFAVAGGQERDARRRQRGDEIKRLATMLAFCKDLRDMAAQVRAAFTAMHLGTIGHEPWEYLDGRREILQRMSIFEIPDEELTIDLLPLPLALSDLADALKDAYQQTGAQRQSQVLATPELERALGIVESRLNKTIPICERAMAAKRLQ